MTKEQVMADTATVAEEEEEGCRGSQQPAWSVS